MWDLERWSSSALHSQPPALQGKVLISLSKSKVLWCPPHSIPDVSPSSDLAAETWFTIPTSASCCCCSPSCNVLLQNSSRTLSPDLWRGLCYLLYVTLGFEPPGANFKSIFHIPYLSEQSSTTIAAAQCTVAKSEALPLDRGQQWVLIATYWISGIGRTCQVRDSSIVQVCPGFCLFQLQALL